MQVSWQPGDQYLSNFVKLMSVVCRLCVLFQLIFCKITWKESVASLEIEQFLTASGFPAAMMWKTQGSFCSATAFFDQHINVPYSKVRVGVKVRTLRDPLVRIKRSSTCLASAELLNVHLKQKSIFN